MALLFMDGFGGQDQTYKWDNGSTPLGPATASPRVPGCYYASISGQVNLYKNIPASNQVFVGAGVYINLSSFYFSFLGDTAATRHITIIRNATSGLLEIRRGTSTGTLLATGVTPIYPSTWTYVEISCTIDDVAGEVHVRLDGSTADDVSYVGDTRNGGTATTIDQVHVHYESGVTGRLADLYILNSTGAMNNTFLGDVAVRTLSPSGNGTFSQLTGSDGDQIDNYLLVDEHPFASADYVGSAVAGQRDTYVIADLPAGITTVYGVQVGGRMAKSEATLAQSKLVLRSGGSLYYSSDKVLSTSYIGYYELYETDPNTAAQWVVANVNSAEIGMEVV